MLFLHCGWPRTGTTSLQAALHEHADELAAAGIRYPDRWRSEIGFTHHGLADVLQAAPDSGPEFGRFMRFLEASSGGSVLFSSEVLSSWLISDQRQAAFLEFLAATQEVMPTRCIWTLRRYDELVRSWLLLGVKHSDRRFHGARPPLDTEQIDARFEGMRRVEDAVGGNAVYCKYDHRGVHIEELLRAFDVPAETAAEIQAWIKSNPNLNAGPTHKQAIALLCIDALSARAGVSLDEGALRAAFRQGEFEFEDDRPCELTNPEWQEELREAALSAAGRHGILAYVRFFQNAGSEQFGESERDASAITDADLERLVSFLRPHADQGGRHNAGDRDSA